MTVAVAVRKDGQTAFAADSLVNFGGERYGADNARFCKLYYVGDSVLAWAGWSVYGELLLAYLGSHRERKSELATETQVFDFFVSFWRSLTTEYFSASLTVDRARSGAAPPLDLDSMFLLANQHGIFRIAGDLDVTKFRRYSAIGSGAPYALGALSVLYDDDEEPVKIARRAVRVGIEFDIHCGGDIDSIELAERDPVEPRAPDRLRRRGDPADGPVRSNHRREWYK